MVEEKNFEQITIIVQSRDEKKLLWALREVKAPGITYFYGHGTGVRERYDLPAGSVQGEKVVFITVVPPDITESILRAVSKAVDLEQPGRAFVTIQKVTKVLGYF
jgi:nitrogen regulatory protein PII